MDFNLTEEHIMIRDAARGCACDSACECYGAPARVDAQRAHWTTNNAQRAKETTNTEQRAHQTCLDQNGQFSTHAHTSPTVEESRACTPAAWSALKYGPSWQPQLCHLFGAVLSFWKRAKEKEKWEKEGKNEGGRAEEEGSCDVDGLIRGRGGRLKRKR